MTCRELEWAAVAASRERWAHTVTVVRRLVKAWSGEELRAEDIAPPGVFEPPKPPRELTPEEQEARDAHSFNSFLTAFTTVYGAR